MLLRIQGAYHRAQPRGTSAHVITPRTFHNLGPSGSPRGPGGDPPKAAWRGWRTRGDRVAGVRVAGVRVAGRAGPDQARGSGHPASGIGHRAAGTGSGQRARIRPGAPGTGHRAPGSGRFPVQQPYFGGRSGHDGPSNATRCANDAQKGK